jgi:hypothetical protein
MEIRGNTAAEYMSTYDGLLADSANWNMTFATNPETAAAVRAVVAADGRDSLDVATWRTGERMITSLILVYERAYFARFYGRLGDAEWSRFQRLMCEPDNIGLRSLQSGVVGYGNFSDEFSQYLSQCSTE